MSVVASAVVCRLQQGCIPNKCMYHGSSQAASQQVHGGMALAITWQVSHHVHQTFSDPMTEKFGRNRKPNGKRTEKKKAKYNKT